MKLVRLSQAAAALSLLSCFAPAAFAGTMCSNNTCSVTIASDPSAPISNFQNPSATAQQGYSIQTSDNGTNFVVTLNDTGASLGSFANLYFDTIADTPNTGSNLGFEFGVNSEDSFDPNTGKKYDLTGTGVTSVFTPTASGTLAVITIPNTFFLDNPLGMAFTDTQAGGTVSLHLSQAFGYSVVGGSANFAAPVELGAATIARPSGLPATPEPSSWLLLGTGMACVAVFGIKRSVL